MDASAGGEASEEQMLILARALLAEACSRTGPRLAQARALAQGLPEEETLRAATAEARRVLRISEGAHVAAGAADAATPASSSSSQPPPGDLAGAEDEEQPPGSLELLRCLAVVETSAQQLLMAVAAPDHRGGDEGRQTDEQARPSEEQRGEGSRRSSLPVVPPLDHPKALPGLVKPSLWQQLREQLDQPLKDRLPCRTSSLSGNQDSSPRQAQAEEPGRGRFPSLVVDELLLERWASDDALIGANSFELLQQLAQDAALLVEANGHMASLIEGHGEVLDDVEQAVLETRDNTAVAAEELGTALKAKGKRRPLQASLLLMAGGTVTGLVCGAPAVPAFVLGTAAGTIGGISTLAVRAIIRKRVDRKLGKAASTSPLASPRDSLCGAPAPDLS